MTILATQRLSDSPYIDSVTHGETISAGSSIRPAEIQWHMVVLKLEGKLQLMVVGPLTSAGVAKWGEGAELIWIKFRLGMYMPHLPIRDLLNTQTALPSAADKSFYLNGSAWQFPDQDNVETFVDRLVRTEILVRDPVVTAVREGHQPEISPRTLRHRFLNTAGMAQNQIYQFERAQHAADLLRQGTSILDTVDESGYYDQPHLTRALKQWLGYTPAQISPPTTTVVLEK